MKDAIESGSYKEIYEDIRTLLLRPWLQARLKFEGVDPELMVHNLNLLFSALQNERFFAAEKRAEADDALSEISAHLQTLNKLTAKLLKKAGESHRFHPQLTEIQGCVNEAIKSLPIGKLPRKRNR